MEREAFIIRDAITGRRLAAAWNGLEAEEKAASLEADGVAVAVDRTVVTKPDPTPAPTQTKPRRKRERRPMRFYEGGGMIYCRDCRDNLLTNAWRVAAWKDDMGRGQLVVSDEPPLRPSDFQALGERPWAGNDVGERYIQCDECNGQWGPDA